MVTDAGSSDWSLEIILQDIGRRRSSYEGGRGRQEEEEQEASGGRAGQINLGGGRRWWHLHGDPGRPQTVAGLSVLSTSGHCRRPALAAAEEQESLLTVHWRPAHRRYTAPAAGGKQTNKQTPAARVAGDAEEQTATLPR